MSSETTEQRAEGVDDRSAGSRILSWLAAFIILVVVLLAFMHVFAPAIGRDEEPPPGHWQTTCIACHLVTSAAENGTP